MNTVSGDIDISPRGGTAVAMRALLRDRSYRRLLIGQTLSAFGDYAMFLALAVWVKALTGSNAKAGLAILPFVLPSLFGPALGVYVDRFPRRRVMIVTDLAAALRLLPLLAVHDAGDIWLIYVASFLLGLATVVYDAARAGLLVSMLDGDDLGDANGLLQSTNQGMRLLAPLAGAALFAAFGGHAVALPGRDDLRRLGAVPARRPRADDRARRRGARVLGGAARRAPPHRRTRPTSAGSPSRPPSSRSPRA